MDAKEWDLRHDIEARHVIAYPLSGTLKKT